MKKLRILYFGTPQLSADILSHLLGQSEVLEIVGVISTPDAVGGRGHQIIPSAVSSLAREKGIPLLQPEKVRNNETFFDAVRELRPDICIVVAYGKILPQVLLDIPAMGFLNVHTSLLPKYRGAAPIQYALLNGEKTTGLTVQQMSLGMDEGDILMQELWEVTPLDTTGSLFTKTGERGGSLLVETLKGITDKTLTPRAQDHEQATYTKYIEKNDGEVRSEWTVDEIYHRWQAYTPWPGIFTFYGDMKIGILKVKIMKNEQGTMNNREIISHDTQFVVIDGLPALKMADGYILIEELHPAGKKPMKGEDFVRGYFQQSTKAKSKEQK